MNASKADQEVKRKYHATKEHSSKFTDIDSAILTCLSRGRPRPALQGPSQVQLDHQRTLRLEQHVPRTRSQDHRASQLKHAAYLLNALNFGSAAKIDNGDVRWDAASSTAIVKATRYVRPAFFPLFEFAVPTKLVLSFHAQDGEKETLYCTQWRDEWPLEQVIQAVPS